MCQRTSAPSDNTWERCVGTGDTKERAEILRTPRDVRDIDAEADEQHRQPDEDERRPHLNFVRVVCEEQERQCYIMANIVRTDVVNQNKRGSLAKTYGGTVKS